MRVLAAALAIYAVYLPIAWLVHRDYVPPPRPAGSRVEMIYRFDLDKPHTYCARSYLFGPAKYPDTSQIRVYEGVAPLAVENTWFTADGPAYVVCIQLPDSSDPRANGRTYWLGLPAD